MIRLLMNLLGREYEPCKSCETLRVQLEIMRAENTRMLDTILGFVKPEVIVADVKHTEPIKGKAMSWHQRKTLLEAESRERARAIKTLKLSNDAIGQSNSGIEELEKELGIEDAS